LTLSFFDNLFFKQINDSLMLRNVKKDQNFFSSIMLISFLIQFLFVIGFYYLGNNFLDLIYSFEFVSNTVVSQLVLILIFSSTFYNSISIIKSFLIQNSQFKEITLLNFIKSLALLFFSLLLFPSLNILGVVISYSISNFLRFIFIIYFFTKRFKINPFKLLYNIFKPLTFVILISFTSSFFILDSINITNSNLINIVFKAIIITFLYIVSIFLSHSIKLFKTRYEL
jgi:O-antigen/teichoic acid export membrane protein